ncbi:MAG: helix-turn-helix domain-containing protein [Rickettsiales bacterium]|jgi:probable addiction module antidote protein|nr:helix-turn-helix domain-containing protein [Rickettsiales bacterium]
MKNTLKDCPIPLKTSSYELLSYDDLKIKMFREEPEFATIRIENELEEYLKTGDPTYLRIQFKTAVRAFGYCNFERKTGLSRRAIYNILNGKSEPKFKTVLKFLDALGYSVDSVKCSLSQKVINA